MNSDLETRFIQMTAALAARGLATTPRRVKLLEVLLTSEHHPSVSEIHRDLKSFFPSTSLATIYNTIELLKETGQVLEIEFSGAANRYDGRRPTPHPHVICLECDRIEDLHVVKPNKSLELISAETGYKIVRERTDYYGVCPQCNGNKGAP